MSKITDIMGALDSIDAQLTTIKPKLIEATSEATKLQGKFDLIEARVYDEIGDEVAKSSRTDHSKRLARIEAEDENELLWTRLHDAKAERDSLDKQVNILDIQRSNKQSVLKRLSGGH